MALKKLSTPSQLRSLADDHDLPEEMFEEIMAWLPPEALIRSKSVSKSWHSRINRLINDPKFVSKHRDNAKKQSTSTILRVVSFESGLDTCQLIDADQALGGGNDDDIHYSVVEEFALSLSPAEKEKTSLIINAFHCDGLVCVVNIDLTIALCNPAMRQFRLLPEVERCRGFEDRLGIETVGFGYDSVDDDYKIVRVWNYNKNNQSVVELEMFSVRTGTWRDCNKTINVDPSLPYCCGLFQKLHHRGVCYFIADKGYEKSLLVSLDLHTEVTETVLCPVGPPTYGGGELTVLDDAVAYVAFSGEPWVRSAVWVYGLRKGCWTKRLSIGPLEGVYGPLRLWTKEELLLRTEYGSVARLYNLRSGKSRRLITVEATREVNWWEFYVKTLVSIAWPT